MILTGSFNRGGQKSIPMSYSKASTYKSCSLKYYFAYEAKPAVVKDKLDLDFGNVIHYALNSFHKQIEEEDKFPEMDSLIQDFIDEWEHKVLFSQAEITKEAAALHRDMGISMLTKYYIDNKDNKEWFSPPVRIQNNMDQIGCELTFNAPIIDFRTGEIIADGYHLYGIIDLILPEYQNKIVLIDHKTAKREYSDDKIKNDMQLTTYYYALQYLIKTNVILNPKNLEIGVGFNIFYKKKTIDVIKYITTRNDGDLDRFFQTIKSVVYGIEHKVYVPNDDSILCSWCDYKEPCIFWGKYGDKWKNEFVSAQQVKAIEPKKIVEIEAEDKIKI